jgi:8-oxo-dGTP pyrophosphatase MutT (NUDIX family)
MPQSYEVYILNRPVIFGTQTPLSEAGLVLNEPSDVVLKSLPNVLRKRPDLPRVWLVAEDVEALWIRFCMGYREVLAAGCIVENEYGELLWMKRNGRWDLPKGKVESGERIEDAAVREVEEETGIGHLELKGALGQTYHTYEMNGNVELKTTFWFKAIHTGGRTAGIPQKEEGISAIVWVPRPMPEDMLASTFASLRRLIEEQL